MFVYWGIVIGVVFFANVIVLARRRMSTRKMAHPKGPSQNRQILLYERLQNQVRANFLLSATFNKTCSVHSLFGTIRPCAETAIISIYVALHVILCAMSYGAIQHNPYWESNSIKTWSCFSNRMGYLAYASFTIFFASGIRNYILVWMTD